MGATYADSTPPSACTPGVSSAARPAALNSGPDPVRQGALAHRAMGANARPRARDRVPRRSATIPPVNGDQVVRQWIATDDLADDGRDDGSVPVTPSSTVNGGRPGGRAYKVDLYADRAGVCPHRALGRAGNGARVVGRLRVRALHRPNGPDATAASWAFFRAHPRR